MLPNHLRTTLIASWLVVVSFACGSTPSATTAPTATITPLPGAPSPAPKPAAKVITPNAIQCGNEQCKLGTEACCDGATPHCVPKPADGSYACGEGELIKQCDESADCESGSRCCKTWGCTGGCPEELSCEADACVWGMTETCANGAACSEGFRCDTKNDPPTCVLDPEPAPRCGATTCAPGQSCCWNGETKTGTCAADCPEEGVTFACTSPTQCGGHPCASWKRMGDPRPGVFIHCASAADVGDSYGRALCEKLADCPRRMGMDPVACATSNEGMPSVRECNYGSDE